MNTLLNNMKAAANYAYTENGGLSHRETGSKVLDMFALGGAYRQRSEADCILLFKNAFEEDEALAMKCLFYLRDIRGGQGERRYFRTCFNWLAKEHPEAAKRNLEYVAEYGRWDDLIYSCVGTKLESDMLAIIKHQLALDVQCKTPSLMAKWIPSENASSKSTKKVATIIRNYLGVTHKEYRKMLSDLRSRINIVEKLMSQNRWSEISFDKIPSRAGLIYKNAFARRDILAKKYEEFVKDDTKKVNADALYPYDIVAKALECRGTTLDNVDRLAVNKFWANQKDWLNGQPCKMLCVCDASGSMIWGQGASTPINVAIGLSLYCAERVGGPFKNHYISFASRPQLIETTGVDFVDKVERIYRTNLCDNTDLVKTFRLLKDLSVNARPEDRLDTIVVLSDMEIDYMTGGYGGGHRWTERTTATEMEKIRQEWEAVGLKVPRLVYWNINCRSDRILDLGPNATFVSGASASTFESILTGKSGYDLMLEKLLSKRYEVIH